MMSKSCNLTVCCIKVISMPNLLEDPPTTVKIFTVYSNQYVSLSISEPKLKWSVSDRSLDDLYPYGR